MENLIYDAVNNFRSAKQVKSYTKARKKSSAPAKPFPGISLQDSQQRTYFADPFGSRVALAAPFQYSPVSDLSILNGSINGVAPMVIDQEQMAEKEEEEVEDDEALVEKAEGIQKGTITTGDDDGDDGQSDATQPLDNKRSRYDSSDDEEDEEDEASDNEYQADDAESDDGIGLHSMGYGKGGAKRTVNDLTGDSEEQDRRQRARREEEERRRRNTDFLEGLVHQRNYSTDEDEPDYATRDENREYNKREFERQYSQWNHPERAWARRYLLTENRRRTDPDAPTDNEDDSEDDDSDDDNTESEYETDSDDEGGARTGEEEWEAFMNDDEPEAPRPSKKRGRKPDQLHTIFQGDKQLFEKLMRGEGEVKKYQLINVTSKQLEEMEQKGDVMKWPVLRTDVPTKAKESKKKPKTDLKKMFGKGGCCECGGQRVQTSLYRRHKSKDALDVGKMKDFVFFTTDDDDERYDDRGDEQQGYDLDADLIVVDDEEDPLYDILGGMAVGESKKLLKALKKSNADKDGLYFPGNQEIVLWNFDNLAQK